MGPVATQPARLQEPLSGEHWVRLSHAVIMLLLYTGPWAGFRRHGLTEGIVPCVSVIVGKAVGILAGGDVQEPTCTRQLPLPFCLVSSESCAGK